MAMWLVVACAVAFGSALLPLVSTELFVVGLMSRQPSTPVLALGIAVAVGQVGGKLVYFLAARGSIRLPARFRREPGPPSAWRARWQLGTRGLRSTLDRLRERCHRHTGWMIGTHGISSVVGLPPFMATTVLAGLVRMPVTAFLAVGVLGRSIRFTLLAAAPAMLAGWAL